MGRSAVCAVVVVCGVGVLAGCDSGGSSDRRTTPADKSRPAPATTGFVPAARRPEIVAAYTGYWSAFVSATTSATSATTVLAQVAGGAELARAVDVVRSRKASKQYLSGAYTHAMTLVSARQNTAVITDCLGVQTVVHDAATRRVVEKSPPGPFPVNVTLARQDDRWKVTAVKSGTSSCGGTAAASPTASR